MEKIKRIACSQATRFVAVMIGLWAVVAYLTDSRQMFLIGNAVMTSISVAIMVAYWRVAANAFLAENMSRAHLLGLGIFFAWAGTAVLRTITVLVYGFNVKAGGTDFSTFGLHLQLIAACLHLAAPVLDPGGIWPVRERIKTGLWAGAGVFVLTILLLMNHMS